MKKVQFSFGFEDNEKQFVLLIESGRALSGPDVIDAIRTWVDTHKNNIESIIQWGRDNKGQCLTQDMDIGKQKKH